VLLTRAINDQGHEAGGQGSHLVGIEIPAHVVDRASVISRSSSSK